MIIGEKINIRALNRIDRDILLKWVNDPELKNFSGTIYPVTDVEHEKWFETKLIEPLNKIYAIETKEKNIIGIIGNKNFDYINSNTEIYISIGEKEFWNYGFGTEAVSLFISFCFNQLNLHKVYLYVFDYNQRAIKSYEKIGFSKEGVLKESLYKNGKYHNKILMSIINN